MSDTKYVMTPSHPEYKNRDINISAYCKVVECTFNEFKKRVFKVAWYSSTGEKLFYEVCYPREVTPLRQPKEKQQKDPNMLHRKTAYRDFYELDNPCTEFNYQKEGKSKCLDIWGEE